MSLRLRSLYFLLALALPIAAFAQSDKPKDYSKELCVIEKALTHITVAEDGSDDQHQESVVRLTSQAGVEQFGLLKLGYPKATTTLVVDYVRVRKPDGKVIETALDAIDDMPADITRQAPQYSDLREKHIAVRGLSVGDLLEFSYTLHSKPLVPGQYSEVFNVEDGTLAQSVVVEIDAPANKPLKIRSEKIKPVIKEENGRRLYKWTYDVKEIKKHAVEPIPGPPDVLVATFGSWNEVGQWWKTLSAESTEPTQEIVAKAKYLTADAKTDEEKTRDLYNYVSGQFRYIGINFGIGRYQPHAALDVFQNGFGDCKDKYALLAALLKAVGISSQPALLNLERTIDPDVPSPAQFDHVVLIAKVNGKEVWLDPTLEVAPYGFLAFIERGRYALVMRDGASTLEKIPEGMSHASSFDFDAEGELSSAGVFKGHVVSNFQGSLAIVFRSAFRSVPQTKWQELAQGISHRQGFGGQVSNVEVTGIDDPEKAVRVSYDYERKNYSQFDESRITPPFPPSGLALREDPLDPSDPLPKEIFLGEPSEMHFHAKIKLPQGFAAITPSNANVHTDFIDYTSSMRLEGSVLTAERKVSSKIVSMPQSRRPDFLKFAREVYDSEISTVRLVHPDGLNAGKDSGDSGTIVLNQEGIDDAKLFEQARNSLVRGRHEAAELTLKQLIQKNPSYPNAHAMLATVYMARNQQGKVADEFDKEFTGNPEALMSYRMYAGYLTSQRRYKEARAVWARCVKNLPQIADAWQSMAEIDGYLEDYPNAIVEIKKAIELDPDSSTPQLTYGNLLVKSGEKEKGFELLLKEVADNPKADYQNTIAYEMADSDYRLEKAEELAKQAVSSLEAETTRIQLGNITSFDLRRMPSLSAYWDTLGWVYFKQGKFDDAQRYLKAAWELSPLDVIATHLTMAYEKAGKVSPAANYKSVEKTQQLRSTKLTLAFPTPENGEFYFLFGEGGKLENVQYISGGQRMKTPASIAQIKRAHFHTIVPPGDPQTRVIRRGSIFCSGSNSPCMAVLFEVTDVRSTTEDNVPPPREIVIRK